MKGLSGKQKTFCEEYHLTGNATQSAIKAGYSPKLKSAEAMGSRLLSNDKVGKYLEELRKSAGDKHTISRDMILDELAIIITERTNNPVKDRLKAMEIANKMCGFNEPEKHDHTGELDFKIEYVEVGSREDAKKEVKNEKETKTNKKEDKPVVDGRTQVVVRVDVFKALTNYLGTLPHNDVAGLLQALSGCGDLATFNKANEVK